MTDGRQTHEFEEHVWGRNVEIAAHLIGVVSTPIARLSHEGRAFKRAMELRLIRQRQIAVAGCDREHVPIRPRRPRRLPSSSSGRILAFRGCGAAGRHD
jgi:hypothetical protein